jgi:predicted ATPase/class 3 adenylate cyclase
MSVRPTGTVTFLFTDIEGSTQRWERDADAMASALARHDALMREAIESNRGFVFKVVGDAFCAAFARTADAVTAALYAQRSLLAADFSRVDGMVVRMAVHSGNAEERKGDYLGPAVNRVARLLSIGHGGQVLISQTAAELVQDALPPRGTLRDLGTHKLKDLARSEHVFQLVAPDLLEGFPPLRSLEQFPNNLPQQLTSFVGRETELEEIKQLMREHHLVTLVGTGGAGKTRCAIAAGADLLEAFGEGVWLVELAPISNSSLVTAEIAQILGVREAPNRPLLETLLEFLERRNILLILDNCEHLIAETRSVAGAILRRCPGVRILATSRESFGIAGERAFRLPSLAVPPMGEQLTAERTGTYGAVALFADRARSSEGHFTLTDLNAPFVTEIVARLDGIPLAIELAAARVKVVSLGQLTSKLNERFRVLTGGDRSALPRQQTLRATIDWSFDLLEERERTLFRRLSVFAGGWTLQAAIDTCGDEAIDEWEMLDLLSSLVEKSLIVVDATESDERFQMLASIREYARERLIEAGEAERIAAKHARFFATLVRGLQPLVLDLEDVEWKRLFGAELDNVRAALAWTIFEKRDPAIGLLLLADVEWPELVVTPQEALGWFESAAGYVDAETDAVVSARILRHCVRLDWLVGRPLAQRERTALHAVEVARRSGDANEVARALANLGACYRAAGRFDDAELAFAQAYDAPELLSRITANAVLRLWAVTDLQRNDVDSARRRFSQVVALERPASEAHASALLNLGELEFAVGNIDAARDSARRAKATYARLNSIYLVLVSSNLAAYALAANDVEDARNNLREALELQRATRAGWLGTVVETHAHLAAVLGDHERAALLAGFTDAQYVSHGEVRQSTERWGYERLKAILTQTYAGEELARRLDAGAGLTEEQALAHAAAIHERTIDAAIVSVKGE